MNLLQAYQQLRSLAPTFTTREAAAVLGITPHYASIVLSRLARQGSLIRIVQGRWAYDQALDPLILPNVLIAPGLAYISVYTALYYHGMIEQIPTVIYAVSSTKTKCFKTPFGAISFHHMTGRLFTGFEIYKNTSIMMAVPEKALFDTLYLTPAKSGLFSQLTELELPADFNFDLLQGWIDRVGNVGRQKVIQQRLHDLT